MIARPELELNLTLKCFKFGLKVTQTPPSLKDHPNVQFSNDKIMNTIIDN